MPDVPALPEPLAVGIDLGGTQVRVALVNRQGAILAREATGTDSVGGPTAVMAQFTRLIAAACVDIDTDRIVGVGISAPGPLDSETGTVLEIPTLPGWDDFPLRQRFSEVASLPVTLENDGVAAAYGEWMFGAGRGLRNLVYMTVSTGIGGGVVIDNRLLHGRRGMAGHIGHMRIDRDGPVCSCGAVGCFEAFAAGTALGRAGRAAVQSGRPTLMTSLSDPATLAAHHVVEAARAGDAVAMELLDREAYYLGIGITALVHLYSPDRVIIGGGVSQAFDLLRAGIEAVVQERALRPFRSVEIRTAGLGTNSGLVGAAALAFTAAGVTLQPAASHADVNA